MALPAPLTPCNSLVHITLKLALNDSESLESPEVEAMSSDRVDEEVDILLRRLQQDGCQMLAKGWIRAIEPRKQFKYPYNGGKLKDESIKLYGSANPGALTRPPWWPAEGCRHREPDHVRKEGPSNKLPS